LHWHAALPATASEFVWQDVQESALEIEYLKVPGAQDSHWFGPVFLYPALHKQESALSANPVNGGIS
jgi:hypothetical protein